jgi:hypothetical protein
LRAAPDRTWQVGLPKVEIRECHIAVAAESGHSPLQGEPLKRKTRPQGRAIASISLVSECGI